MARLNRVGFLAVAVVFHLVYIYSIFDIYFVSPIVSGMGPFEVQRHNQEAPARRLVLFVGDGLRADKAFQSFPDPSPSEPGSPSALEPKPLMPFLRSRVLSHGTFGVSHTRVPTESRPGHVALIAGLYEDVSAVTTGWKLNPVNFDSVFNRSRHTWSWGSPDILLMFKEGAVEGRVDADVYGAEAEDFTQDATQLDVWVFEKVKELFALAAKNSTLDAALREDRNVFFLHLLGLDTTGHAYRPYSKEYLHNIKVVDEGVQQITALVDNFYADGKTAFVFTADHGMSDWGSHGDGHPDNTRTPLVAWGAGVAKPVLVEGATAPGHEDVFSNDWGLDHVQRHDVAQADIAALMAYLAGLEFPVNSVGELPLSYLSGNLKEKAEAALANARGILEMYRVKEEQKRSRELRYKPYPPLGDQLHSVEHRVSEVESLISNGNFEDAMTKSAELLHLGLAGLRYLQTYDWLFLRAVVTAGYLGWMAFALTTIIDVHVLHSKTQASRSTAIALFFSSVLVLLYSILWVQESSITYYAYAFFPVVFWEEVIARRAALMAGKKVLLKNVQTTGDYLSLGIKALAFVGLLEALVQSYFHREVFTVCFILGAFWPALYSSSFVSQNRFLVATWATACVLMSTFTLLPVIKIENINMILLGGLLMSVVGLLFLLFEESIISQSKSAEGVFTPTGRTGLPRIITGVQIGLILLAMVVTRSSVASLQAREGLPFGNQVVGWFVFGAVPRLLIDSAKANPKLVTSLTVPFLHALQPIDHYLHRLNVIFLAFSPIFVILTISYEALFYFTFYITLVTWVRLEHKIHAFATATTTTIDSETNGSTGNSNSLDSSQATGKTRSVSQDGDAYRALTLSDVRISLFFLFLLQSAFFSTGNIASISSFSLDSVYRLIPVFNPFSQGALLVLKLMIPFALISANLGVLNRRLGVAPSALFMVVMAISDVLTLNFFFMVRDEGSWLDIGTSISHFCIASLLSVFVAGLEFVSKVFVSGVRVDHRRNLEDRHRGTVTYPDNAGKMANGKGEITAKAGSDTQFWSSWTIPDHANNVQFAQRDG